VSPAALTVAKVLLGHTIQGKITHFLCVLARIIRNVTLQVTYVVHLAATLTNP
jgi:hypothetical protein